MNIFRWTLTSTGLALLMPFACAHHRDFTFSRDWFLPYKGEREIESRSTYIPKDGVFDQEFEFEYGISDDFAIEPGIAFHKDEEDKFHLDAWGVELRFRMGTYAENRLLPAINIEYENPVGDEPTRGEIKFIGSYMTDKGVDITANLNFGQTLSGDHERESELTLGVVFPIGKNSREEMGYNIGTRGGFEFLRDLREGHMLFGPTLIYRPDKTFNILGTVAFPLNNEDENHTQLRLILEYEFPN